MRLKEISPKVATKELLKLRPLRSEIDTFKSNLLDLLGKIDVIEREESQKNHIRDFLLNTFYKESNYINPKNATDLVIHLGKTNKDKVGVILEAKRPSNKAEMLSIEKPNTKALHELVLYYMRERIDENNIDIKNVIATNIYEWFIFDAQYFEKFFARDKAFVKEYTDWRDGKKVTRDTSLFYNEIVKPYIDKIQEEIPVTKFDIRKYERELRNADKKDDKKLIALYKAQSPYHLLRKTATDSNTLDDKFYKELLHIIGLEEAKDSGKNIIRRKQIGRNSGSLIENAIAILETEDLYRVSNLSQYGANNEERVFSIALELSLTWINRILFLKLLEGQLIDYHRGDQGYRFLNGGMIHDFDELYRLFHQVLARRHKDRADSIKEKYKHVPYLNSSLFEISELEEQAIRINSLDNAALLELMPNSVLGDKNKKQTLLPTLEYIFRFLDSYDFASEGKDDIQEDNKTLINASVLGKVFEKINGYKDGSIYTPGFITMYMCREAIRRSVVQKFNGHYGWKCETLNDVHNEINDRKEANQVINSLNICDPAVGSGHFLVSALNEIIAIKAELGILQDNEGKRIKDYNIEVINDELVMIDEYGDPFIYYPNNRESQRIQKTLFQEKQVIIENCLFGVDINANSVKICRLRLWIELLKNAYYTEESGFTELETLPNIDINIKCGNSLVSRYALDADLGKALKNVNHTIPEYKKAVNDFKDATEREEKRKLITLINSIKNDFQTYFSIHDERREKLSKARGELVKLQSDTLFETKKASADVKKKIDTLNKKVKTLEGEIEEIRNNVVYQNAFEWRFEFPEVLDNDGNFEGFDVIIGNPPYIQLQKLGAIADVLQQQGYKTFVRTGDIYCLFYELGVRLLKEDAYLSYITSNKWMRAGYGESIRAYFLNDSNPLQLIDFAGLQLFQNATVDTNILTLQKAKYSGQIQTCVLDNNPDSINNLSDYFRQKATYSTGFSAEKSWAVLSGIETRIKNKIDELGVPLKEWDVQINYGIKTGFNDAFIIDSITKDDLIKKSPESADIIRPILRGRDIKRYLSKYEDLWILFTRRGINIDKYPTIKEHLFQFYDQLKPRTKEDATGRKPGPYKWYEIQDNVAYYERFSEEKIIWIELTDHPNFYLDVNHYYINNTVFFLVGTRLRYLTAFLNSRLCEWYFDKIAATSGVGTRRWIKIYVEQIRIPRDVNSDLENEINNLVDKIQNGKRENIDTSFLQNQIDDIIYSLFNLDISEIAHIKLASL